jgi:DNA polymerase-3 subunit beta
MIDSETVVGTGLRITVSKDDLAAKLAIVARGVSTRTAVLVLGGIQLRAEAGRLHLAATDMELSLRTSLEASVEGEGTTVASCSTSRGRCPTAR